MMNEEAKSTFQEVRKLFQNLSLETQDLVDGVLKIEQTSLHLKKPRGLKLEVLDLVRSIIP